jgi:phenylacetate-CoA ligase
MNPALLRLYHGLPARMRSFVASLHGLYLHKCRYGPESESLVEEVLERDTWSPKRWQDWQEQRLAYVLHRAATRVPYYRDVWARRRRLGDRASWDYLEHWPLLEKEVVRRCPTAFIAEDCNTRRMFHDHTAGTTGKPLDFWWSLRALRTYHALFEARCRRWYGVSRHDRWARVGGQLVTPVKQRRPPFWVWNAGLKQLYMSSFHLAPDLIPHYLDTLQDYRIQYLQGYASSLYALAHEAIRLGRRDLTIHVAVTDSEPLLDYQRQAIAAAFRCPIYESYAMTEFVAAASECQLHQLHTWPEAGLIEVFDGDQLSPRGACGDLVCTGLLNADMVLIRYRVGDRGRLSLADQPCACGRTLPRMGALEGRMDDLFYTSDGRRIGRLDDVFNAQIAMCEGQMIQEAHDRIRVRYVPAQNFTADAEDVIIRRLRDRMGPVEVILERVDKLPRLRNGKFRQAICMLPPEMTINPKHADK